MKSIKYFLILGIITMSTFVNAQVNSPGTIYVGAGFGGTLCGGNLKTERYGRSQSSGCLGAGVNFGLKAQYSFSDKFSAGIYFKKGVTGYANTAENYEWNKLTSKTIIYGVEAKYYLFNKRKILLSLGPQFGLVSSNDGIELGDGVESFDGYEEDGSSKGFNYGLNFGLNLFWSQHIGMFVDVGLNGVSLKGDLDKVYKYEYRISGIGVAAGIGIIAKFGGTPPPPPRE